jgi:hypothetical protein
VTVASDLINTVQVPLVVVEVEMATKITVVLEDDLNGGPAAEAVRFAVGTRGRIPADVVAQYEAATGGG